MSAVGQEISSQGEKSLMLFNHLFNVFSCVISESFLLITRKKSQQPNNCQLFSINSIDNL